MKNAVLVLVLMMSANASAQDSFEIVSDEVRDVCDTGARQELYVKQIRAAGAYCGQGRYPKLRSHPVIRVGGNENCSKIWAEYSSASGRAQFECVSENLYCELNCSAYGLNFSQCHSKCGGW